MKILIRQAQILDLQSPHHGTVQDILIDNGHIQDIQPTLEASADMEIRRENLHVSPGWIDIFADFCDPGYEFKESLESGAQAAAAGGFTDVFVIPNTKPVIDSKSQVEYIIQKSRALPVNVLPIGAITKNTDGKELAEMYDMNSSGAVAFSDGTRPVQSAGLLLKALQYVKAFKGVIIQLPDDKSVGSSGLVNEGVISTRLGLPGKPMIAEELIIERDCKLAEYTESKVHFTGVTSPQSLEHIRRAKEKNIPVTCSVTPYHLYFSDEDLLDYDTNLKVYPPLRTPSDVAALRQAVENGTVDCIASHHFPHEYDSKVLEFEYAKYGMIGLESAYSVIKTVFPTMLEQKVAALLCLAPRRIFGLDLPSVVAGAPAVLTLFNPTGTGTLTIESSRSKSKNTPFANRELRGKVFGIVNREKLFLNV